MGPQTMGLPLLGLTDFEGASMGGTAIGMGMALFAASTAAALGLAGCSKGIKVPNFIPTTSVAPPTAPAPSTTLPPITTTTEPPAPVVITYKYSSGDAAQTAIRFSGILPSSAAPSGASSACPGDGDPVDPSRELWIKETLTTEITSSLGGDLVVQPLEALGNDAVTDVGTVGVQCVGYTTGGGAEWSNAMPHMPYTFSVWLGYANAITPAAPNGDPTKMNGPLSAPNVTISSQGAEGGVTTTVSGPQAAVTDCPYYANSTSTDYFPLQPLPACS
jgi:hypothetical protein